MDEVAKMKSIDARGEVCPIPVMKAKKALDEMTAGSMLEVLVDYPAAKENVERMVRNANSEVVSINETNGEYHIRIRK